MFFLKVVPAVVVRQIVSHVANVKNGIEVPHGGLRLERRNRVSQHDAYKEQCLEKYTITGTSNRRLLVDEQNLVKIHSL